MTPDNENQNDLYDVTMIGAGPTGMFGAFYAGMREMSCKIIDALPELGGQLTVLYPEKLIYDVPGFPKILARDLVREQWEQIARWEPRLCLGERALKLYQAGGHWVVETNRDLHHSRTVVICAGVGAFTPKKLGVESVDHYRGEGVYYFVKEKAPFRGKRLLIVGGGDSAVDWALNLKDYARHITLIHRRDEFRAHPAMVAELKASPVDIKLFYELRAVHGDGHITGATIFNNQTRQEERLEVDMVILNLGFNADLGPLREWGLEVVGRRYLKVNARQETNLPGVYAAGDVATMDGVDPLNLIVIGYAQATIAVNYAYTFNNPGAKAFPGHSSEKTL